MKWRKCLALNHKDFRDFHVLYRHPWNIHLWHWHTQPWPEEACPAAAAQLCPFWWMWHSWLYGTHQIQSVIMVLLREFIATEMYACVIQISNLHTCWSGIVRTQTVKDTTPSNSGPHQSRICLSLVRSWPPAWLSPIRAE